MERPSLQNGIGRGRRYKEEEGIVLTSPSKPPSAPKCVARPPKRLRWFSPYKNRRKKGQLATSAKVALGGSLPSPGVSKEGESEIMQESPPGAARRCAPGAL